MIPLRIALAAIREAALIHRPSLVAKDGKLGDNAHEYIRVCDIHTAIADAAPFETAHPGHDGNWSVKKLKAAVANGYTSLVTVWDSNFSIVVDPIGRWLIHGRGS